MTIAICDRKNLQVLFTYQADAPNQLGFGGIWGDPLVTVHIGVPNGTDVSEYNVQSVSGGISLVADSAKVKAYQQNQNLLALQNYTASRSAQCELDIQKALKDGTAQDADYTTHLMVVSWASDVVQSPGNFTTEEHAQALATLGIYRAIYPTVQGLRAVRDADIAAFTPPYPSVSPRYPS